MPATLLLTDALADELANAVREGVPIETATQAAGISPRQAYEWLAVSQRQTWHDGSPVRPEALATISSFAEKIRRAEAEWEAAQVRAIREDAEAYNAKTGLRDWRARSFLLTSHPRTRKRWGQHVEVVNSGTVAHEFKLASSLPIDALDQAFDALPPGPPPPP